MIGEPAEKLEVKRLSQERVIRDPSPRIVKADLYDQEIKRAEMRLRLSKEEDNIPPEQSIE